LADVVLGVTMEPQLRGFTAEFSVSSTIANSGARTMMSKTARATIFGALVFGGFFVANPATAQVSATAIGVAEYDTDGTLLLLGGVSAGPGGRGWKPRFGVQAYHLGYDGGAGDVSVFSVRPYVGMRNLFDGGSVGVNVGYAFSNKDFDVTPAFISESGDGVTLSGGLDYWGTTNTRMGYQALAAYNFGTEGFWGRGRATTRIGEMRANNAQTRLGAEVAFLAGDGYHGFQPGGVVEFHTGGGRIFGLGAGMKFFQGGGDAVYFKGEVTLPLAR
jgi:hypothetical protein